ncbi:hypothetical protein KR018_004669 [Drosophila ironensis]|nr:hypothetical protein KR018_004669 [Drosophila ironensis]
MDQLCRVCGSHSVTLVGIFDLREQRKVQGEIEPNLAEMIRRCADVRVDSGDSLPQKICMSCVLDAQTAYRFKRRCERSYEGYCLAITLDKEIKQELEEDVITEKCEFKGFSFSEHLEKQEAPHLQDTNKKIRKERKHRVSKVEKPSTSQQFGPENAETITKSFQCELCDKEFQRHRNLIDHMRIHTNSHCCQTCGERFLFKTDLDLHHCFRANDSTVECPVCQRVFATSRALDIHKCQQMKERPFKCAHCPQTFTHEHFLRAHLLIHPAEEPSSLPPGRHKCALCVMAFTNKAALQVHLNAHKGERPHACPTCPATFRCKQSLKLHIRTHTGEKPYQCPLCPKTFSDNNNLAKHRRRHSDERPYQCLICAMCFREKHHMKRHVLGKHRANDTNSAIG